MAETIMEQAGGWKLENRRIATGARVATLALAAIMALAAVLRFANLESLGDGNLYYTAAVKAMLQSPSNFFFAAAEPGGSVTVDKPPLGLWIQAISAAIFGVNGFGVILPQLAAGVLSVPMVYWLAKRHFGTASGLIAAAAQAVAPAAIAAERNNTMDATLVFTLLAAAWAFVKATDTGRLRWLIIGGALAGLGFNIKMMQAFLPLPAFYALYFFGAKAGLRRKIAGLGAATAVILAVSLAWPLAVDLTPADQRPFVGSTTENSVFELIMGHNGLNRLFGGEGRGGGPAGAPPQEDGNFQPPQGDGNFARPNDGNFVQPQGQAGGGMFQEEVGQPGILRLMTAPLGNEVGWLIPFGLIATAALIIGARARWPVSETHQAAILFGGWLATEIVFFSVAEFFHAYYMIMLVPPLAALIGVGTIQLWRASAARRWAAIVMVAASFTTVAAEAWIASQYGVTSWLLLPLPLLLMAGGVALLISEAGAAAGERTAFGFASLAAAALIIPAIWAGLTVFDTNGSAALPHSYSGAAQGQMGPGGLPMDGGIDRRAANESLLAYLQANTQGMKYLMAVQSSMQGASYVIETGRPVLYMGGFGGNDPVVDANDLAALVQRGELRFALALRRSPPPSTNGISAWLNSACAPVNGLQTPSQGPPGPGQGATLYDCGG